MVQRMGLGLFGTVVAVAAFAVGCGAAQSTDEGVSAEKVGATSQAVIQPNKTPPPTFPFGVSYAPFQPPNSSTYWKNYATCSGWLRQVGGSPSAAGMWTSASQCDPDGSNCGNFLAHPTTNSVDLHGVSDPYTTTYSHGYQYNATQCATGDLTCQAGSDFFSIASAQGFKYLVDQVVSFTCGTAVTVDGGRVVQRCSANTGPVVHSYYYSALTRVDQSWWFKPWQYQSGVPAPWAQLTNPGGDFPFFDINAHPAAGNGASGDWKSDWDFAYTYADPNGYYQGGQAKNIQAQAHQCSMIYRPIPGNIFRDGIAGVAPVDFFVAGETHDPISGCGSGGCAW